MPNMRLSLFWLALVVMFVVQIYLFVALPAWLLRLARPAPAVTADSEPDHRCLSGVAATRATCSTGSGCCCWRRPAVVGGGRVVAIATVTHVAASSSARVVKMSVRLRPAAAQAPPATEPGG